MFSYNENKNESSLYITSTTRMDYDYNFLDCIAEMLRVAMESPCKNIFFSVNGEISGLAVAYLHNSMEFLLESKVVYVHNTLLETLKRRVLSYENKRFEKINILDTIQNEKIKRYTYTDEKQADATVKLLVDFIMSKNIVIGEMKEFLITVIGEIFSNAFNHSNQNKVHFMYDIEQKNKNIYLIINISDFGNNIVKNVQGYFMQNYAVEKESQQCLEWAIQEGHTTRSGSGGHGLPMLINYINNIEGELLIYSGDGIYVLREKRSDIKKSKGYFYGTSITMKIPILDISKAISYNKENSEIVSINLNDL